MAKIDPDRYGVNTLAVRAGRQPTGEGEHSEPMFLTSSFVFIVSFIVNGGKEAAWRLIDNTELFSITANLGDSKSTITHPATTTHNRLTDEEKQQSGIEPGLVRLSVGHEDVADLKDDLETALTKARQ